MRARDGVRFEDTVTQPVFEDVQSANAVRGRSLVMVREIFTDYFVSEAFGLAVLENQNEEKVYSQLTLFVDTVIGDGVRYFG
ncbi:hypothetical protein PR048_000973 [Dryococelus australis]|uniref:Uncharacterized protein n=1 Tax=Dryococelus australis TaxID=614101 RepID=A0ABQ9IG36_9NEOP|nr:hypothetical protein PR048_000973 [Dryococelus australis]